VADILAPPGHRSFSQIKTYLHCAHQYRLARVLRYQETPAWYLAGGSAVHEVVEHLTRQYATDRTQPDPDTILQLWLEAWDANVTRNEQESGVPTDQWRAAGRVTKDKPNKEDGDWWANEGYQMCLRYAGWIVQSDMLVYEDDEGPWVERGMTVPINGVMVKMFVDAVFVLNGGELLVVDHKTGSRTPDATQLRLYAQGMAAAGHPRPSLGAYWMSRSGELTAPSVLGDGFDPVLGSMFRHVDLAIRGGIYPPNVGTHCVSCGVNKFCAAYGGAESENDPIREEGV
jgi:hypothetical protein